VTSLVRLARPGLLHASNALTSRLSRRLLWPSSSGTPTRPLSSPDAAKKRARGGGLEPPMTGPEPVVLPITPPPNGQVGSLADNVAPPQHAQVVAVAGTLAGESGRGDKVMPRWRSSGGRGAAVLFEGAFSGGGQTGQDPLAPEQLERFEQGWADCATGDGQPDRGLRLG